MATTKTRNRRWTRWVVLAVVVAVVALVGGPFVYIHFIEGKAPSKLKLSTAPSSAGPATVSTDGVWKVASGSQAGYRVKEVLFGQSHAAVGRTSAVTGTVTIAGARVAEGTFTVDLRTVKSDQARRDAQFQGRIMDTASHPDATFALSQPIDLGSVPSPGRTVNASASGRLTLRSTTKSVAFGVTARRTGNTIQVNGSIPVTFADYRIPNPSFAGITTEDHGELEFLLSLTHA